MAVKRVRWLEAITTDRFEFGGHDLHVLANNTPSRPLESMLFIDYDPPANPPAGYQHPAQPAPATKARPVLEVVFEPEVQYTPVPNTNVVVTTSGVNIDKKAGVVQYVTPAAGLTLDNFIIRAIVKENGVEFPEQPLIRIHLHHGIKSAWLTPSTLTIRKDPNPATSPLPKPRFRVMAEFTEDAAGIKTTVGDISNTLGMTWTSRKPTAVTAGGAWGLLRAEQENTDAQISVQLPSTLNSFTVPDGLVKTLPPWSTPTAAQILGFKTGSARIPGRMNLLFVSEGFPDTPAERTAFNDAVVKWADVIRSKPGVAPFSMMKDAINVWSVFVPSREVGTTTLQEVSPLVIKSEERWYDVPAPGAYPGKTGAIGELFTLVRAVGLPIPSDPTISLKDRITGWETLYGTAFGKLTGRIDQKVLDKWYELRPRRLFDALDTAFGIEIGERPAASPTARAAAIALSPFRVNRTVIDEFLKALTDGPGGANLGHVWAKADSPDRTNVFFVCRGAQLGGAFDPVNKVVALSMTDTPYVLAEPPTASRPAARVLKPFPVPKDIAVSVQGAVVHEWGHALGERTGVGGGLGDEYGNLPTLTIPQSQVPFVKLYPNIQARGDLLTGGKLDGTKVKWGRWHRIDRVASLLTVTKVSASKLDVTTYKPKPHPFKAGERVWIRSRPLVSAAPAIECTVDSITPPNRLTISSVSAADLSKHNAESIIYVPKRTTGSTPADLTLVAKVIQQQITTSGVPLNAKNTSHVCTYTGGSTMQADNLPPSGVPKNVRFTRWIIGIYDGGANYSCGVYHPTGACLMRTHFETVEKDGKGIEQITPLCQVCRYILIDHIDPILHPAIDKKYDGAWLEP